MLTEADISLCNEHWQIDPSFDGITLAAKSIVNSVSYFSMLVYIGYW